MNFTKVQGLGNDFVVVNAMEEKNLPDYAEMSVKVCNRNFGIGADGLVLILPSDIADIRMRIFNSDGSEPEMCGNAIRCVAKYVYEKGIVAKETIKVETLAGIIIPQLIITDGRVEKVRVDMGEPRLEREQIPMVGASGQVVAETIDVDGEKLDVTCVSMGNPHCITFVSDTDKVPLTELGPKIETHKLFPNKTNVEFIQLLNISEIKMRVWERGAGETLACGTGACASVVACVLNSQTARQVKVHLAGGDLDIEWGEDNHVYMTGPAVNVFEGKFFI